VLLKDLTQLRGVSGDEGAVRRALQAALTPLGVPQTVDTMGNLLITRDGGDPTAPHVLLAAHMDEVGLIITSATDEGLLRIQPVGGVDPRVIVSKRVLVGDGAVPGVIGAKAIHLQSAEDRTRVLDYGSLYVDVGASTRAKAEELCPPGSYVSFDTPYADFGEGMVKAKALDDRVGCLALVRALQESAYPGRLTCAFTVQEEVGLRGAQVVGYRVAADVAIALEGTTCNDLGDVPEHLRVTRSGQGVALTIMDNRAIVHPVLRKAIEVVAAERRIPWQYKRHISGGTDAGAIQHARGGIPSAVLAVPCRYIHAPISVASHADIAAQQDLMLACLAAFGHRNPLGHEASM
jgi:endoglucanase